LAGDWIAKRHWVAICVEEDASSLLVIGYGRRCVLALYLTVAFIVGKEEELVPLDRASNGAAKLIADQDRNLPLSGEHIQGRTKRTLRVQVGVAVVFPDAAMELIGAAVDGDVDDRARRASILGAVVVGFYAKFIDGIG
jgi:hypothetical protein